MGLLDKFLRTISTRYPESAKLNRTLKTVGRDVEKRHPLESLGLPEDLAEDVTGEGQYYPRADRNPGGLATV